MKALNKINPVWFYRITRLLFAGFFALVGFMYKDAWAAFIFAAIFLVTALMKPKGCVGDSCANPQDK